MPERAGPYGGGPVPPGAFAGRPPASPPPRQDELAEFWRRALAVLVDGLVVALFVLAFFALVAALGDGSSADDDDGNEALFVLLGLAIGFLVAYPVAALVYLSGVMAATNGQTLGKMATGCRVVRTNGKRVDFWWAAWREVVIKGVLLGIAGAITGGLAYLANFLWPLFDAQNRAVHDFVADSRVVRTRG